VEKGAIMKCYKCDVCGRPFDPDAKVTTKLCVPIPVGTRSGDSDHCWCVCNDCKAEFASHSLKVLREKI